MTCKGICSRYKAQKPVGTGRYASGQRRCQICEIFIKWEGLWCPCCGYRLRTKPRNLKYKAKLRARVQADAADESIAIFIRFSYVGLPNALMCLLSISSNKTLSNMLLFKEVSNSFPYNDVIILLF